MICQKKPGEKLHGICVGLSAQFGEKTQCPLITNHNSYPFENCRFRLCSESSVPILFDIPFNTYLLDYGLAPK